MAYRRRSRRRRRGRKGRRGSYMVGRGGIRL